MEPGRRDQPGGARDPDAERELRQASTEGDMAAVNRILAAGRADVNCRGRDGRTPVMAAAHGGHRDVVKLLVGRRADVSLVDEDGDNTLHYACIGGDVETVNFLLSLNVLDIDARNNAGQTAADVARHWRHQAVVDLL